MSNWPSLLAGLNAGVMAAFGREATFTPRLGDPYIIDCVLEQGVQPEDKPLGTYAVLFAPASEFLADPEPGEKVTVDELMYNVVERQTVDGGTGAAASKSHRLLLRFHQEVVS